MAEIDQLYSLQVRQGEIWRRLRRGSLNIEDVLAATQDILDGRYPLKPTQVLPDWYVSPEVQLERVRQLNSERGWGFTESDFPSLPENFRPRTSSEVLLLNVRLHDEENKQGLHCTFDELWDAIQVPSGYTKQRWEFTAKPETLRAVYDYRPGIRWVVFSPNAYQGLSSEAALAKPKKNKVRLAGTEVLMAAVLFPAWVSSWNGTDSPYPSLGGLQVYLDAAWSNVPFLDRQADDHRLVLGIEWSDDEDTYWSVATVREF